MDDHQFTLMMDTLGDLRSDVKEVRKSQEGLTGDHSRITERLGVVETKTKIHAKVTGAVGAGFLGLFLSWLKDKLT